MPDIMSKRASWNCDCGGGGGGGWGQSAVQFGDILNYVTLSEAKITRTAVLLEEIMASRKPK